MSSRRNRASMPRMGCSRVSVWKQSQAQGYGCASASSRESVTVAARARAVAARQVASPHSAPGRENPSAARARSGSRLHADRARLRRTEALAQAAADAVGAVDLQFTVAVEAERAGHGTML